MKFLSVVVAKFWKLKIENKSFLQISVILNQSCIYSILQRGKKFKNAYRSQRSSEVPEDRRIKRLGVISNLSCNQIKNRLRSKILRNTIQKRKPNQDFVRKQKITCQTFLKQCHRQVEFNGHNSTCIIVANELLLFFHMKKMEFVGSRLFRFLLMCFEKRSEQ